MIKGQAEGTIPAIHEQNFMNDVESLLGKSLSSKAKEAFAKITDKKTFVDNMNKEITRISSLSDASLKQETSMIKQKYEAMNDAQKANFDETLGQKKGQFEKDLSELEEQQATEKAGLKSTLSKIDQQARRREIISKIIKYTLFGFGSYNIGRVTGIIL